MDSILNNKPNVEMFDNLGIEMATPCGKLFINVWENTDKTIKRINVNCGSKNGSCLNIIADIVTRLFARKLELHEAHTTYRDDYDGDYLTNCIHILNNMICEKMRGHAKKNKMMWSCADAIAEALREWKNKQERKD